MQRQESALCLCLRKVHNYFKQSSENLRQEWGQNGVTRVGRSSFKLPLKENLWLEIRLSLVQITWIRLLEPHVVKVRIGQMENITVYRDGLCTGLHVCAPLNSYTEILTLKAMVFGGRALGRCPCKRKLSHPLPREETMRQLPSVSQKEALTRTQLRWYPDLGFSIFRPVRNTFLFCSSHSACDTLL